MRAAGRPRDPEAAAAYDEPAWEVLVTFETPAGQLQDVVTLDTPPVSGLVVAWCHRGYVLDHRRGSEWYARPWANG